MTRSLEIVVNTRCEQCLCHDQMLDGVQVSSDEQSWVSSTLLQTGSGLFSRILSRDVYLIVVLDQALSNFS